MLQNVLLVIHLMLAIGMVGVILIQRSEGGGLGIGGGNAGGFMTTRSTANLLTRITGTLAGLFMLTSLVLAYIASHNHQPAGSLFDSGGAPIEAPAVPGPASQGAPVAPPSGAPASAPAAPEEPAKPSVPIVR
jgi:preprotein translocase subunit SecG